ncbi:unnamed protein product [Aspergillus niger]|uniref:Contig An08c0330, genomic contig n=1 Tax=Aspergillus niger (strain ATCC MYA-4892 / CBS 513.88 / FGSC A1513) TaxID=425011 RepID=A2QSV3_ASPNC|nr:unnamed protein product [Aspergillus niger]
MLGEEVRCTTSAAIDSEDKSDDRDAR